MSQAIAGELDDLVEQWIKEAKQLTAAQVPELLAKVKTGDRKSIYLAYVAEGGKLKESFKPVAALHEAIHALAERNDPIGLLMRCELRTNGRLGFETVVGSGLEDCRKAVSIGIDAAALYLGDAYRDGLGVTRDAAAALVWYTKAAEKNNVISMKNLGFMYRDGDGVAKDFSKALEWFTKAAEQNNALAMSSLGLMYEQGLGATTAPALALKWYTKAAEQNEPHAMNNLAVMYRDGRFVKKDAANALKWFTKAAEQSNVMSMKNLGFMYRDGDGIAKDFSKALEWFTKAAELNNTLAMVSIGALYQRGIGVPTDLEAARHWYMKAAAQEDSYAECKLGELERDLGHDDKAIAHFRKGVGLGDPTCMFLLAEMLEIGRGQPRDFNLAARYYLHASRQERERGSTVNAMLVQDVSKASFDELVGQGRITDGKLLQEIRALAKPSPKVVWVGLPNEVRDEATILRVKLNDVGGGIGRVELRVNGSAVGEFKSVAAQRLASASEGVDGVVMEYSIRVPNGEHQLEVIAYNGENLINFTSLTGKLVSAYETPRKPRLFAVVVGIDEFANERLRLKFAGSDAKAVAAALSAQIQLGDLYSGGKVVLLTSRAETRKRKIQDAIAQFQQDEDVRADDVFVLFVATHGSMDVESRTFMLFSAEVLNLSVDRLKETAISDRELRSLIANIPAAKKLILLDACQSGGALREVGAEGFVAVGRRSGMEEQQVIDMMRLRAGATVLAASTAEQSALEGYRGHGVFTWHLLEALRGKAARSGERWVSTDDLKIFVEANVPVVTKREFQQQQVPYASTVGQGFPVAAAVVR